MNEHQQKGMNESLQLTEQHAKRLDLNDRALCDIFNRLSQLEHDARADVKQPGGIFPAPAPQEQELEKLREELANAAHHAEHLEAKIKMLKEERDDQGKEIVELKQELDALKANNRYQKGFEDGATATIRQVREMAAKLKP